MPKKRSTNPFTFGDLALDDAFSDREEEVAELSADIASPVGQAFEKASELFRDLRIRPTMEVDPSDGTLRFSFQAGRRKTDIDETIERLLEKLGELAAERKRRVVIIFDEFQEVLGLDKQFPNLMRAIFQTQ